MRYDDDDAEVNRTGEIPVVNPADPRVTFLGAEMASEVADDGESILPHWTEAPTGQIPAVLQP